MTNPNSTDPTLSRTHLEPNWARSPKALKALLEHDGKNWVQRLWGKLGRKLQNRKRFKALDLVSNRLKINAAPSSRN
jgi:hypothetical protein